MPRPKPPVENTTVKGPHSLPAKVRLALEKLMNPDKPGFEDYSSVLKVALVDYLERHHPGLIEQVAAELRETAIQFPDTNGRTSLRVAESRGVATKLAGVAWTGGDKAAALAAQIGPSPEQMALAELARRKGKKDQRSGGAKGKAKV